jgi:hypothetical protein
LFDELRELCTEAGDKASLAIAMAGLVAEHWQHARMQAAYEIASEQIALVESLADPALTVSAVMAIALESHTGATDDLLRWCEVIIDWASREPVQDSVLTGSPLAMALGFRGFACWWHGRPGWREDVGEAIALARTADPMTQGFLISGKYGLPVPNGVFRIDDIALREIDYALQIAEACGNNNVLGTVNYLLGTALLFRGSATDRRRGRELLAQVRDMSLKKQIPSSELPMIDTYLAYEKARDGDYDSALTQLRMSVDELSIQRRFVYQVGAAGLLVETLLGRATEDDLAEAEATVERLAAIPGDEWVARDIMVLRLRTLLARARGDDAGYRDLRDRYRVLATALGFEGHIQWAEAMT